METRPAIRNVRHESDPVTWIVNYESKKYKIDSKVSGTFSLRIKEIERIIIRSPWGRESLLRQRKKNAEVAFVYEIPPTFLEDNKTFKRFVGNVLSKEGIDSWIQQRLVPKISKDAITTNRLCGGEGKGFIVEVEVELVEETLMDNWLGVDENDPECRRPIEQRCIICLEELSSSSEQKKKKKKILKLRCGHNFHSDCIYSWLRRKHSCPSCRGEINNPRPR